MKHLSFIRRLVKKDTKLKSINVFCLALGLVATGIIISFVYQEFNYDQKNPNSESIYRVIQKDGDQKNPYTFAPLARILKTDFPEIENSVRVSFFYGYLACSANNNKFNEREAIFADPDFFTLFSFPLINGDEEDCLTSPNSVVISEKAAQKYFGNEDPIGKSLQVGEHKEIIVTGIFQNFKSNSNFKGDLIFPLEKISRLTQIWIEPGWKYESEIHTFIRVSSGTSIEKISQKAKNIISNHIEENKIELSFQPLNDIHINRQIFWESTAQTNVKYLYILVAVALTILSISIANFLLLYIGTATKQTTDIAVKKVCGASKYAIFIEHFKEVMVLLILSTFIAVFLFLVYSSIFINYFPFLPQITLLDYKLGILLLTIVLAVGLVAGIYPSVILSSQKPVSIFTTVNVPAIKKIKLVNLLVVGQFALCIILIIAAFTMHKQTNFLSNKDIGFAKDELITIPLNMHIGQGINNEKFNVFAEELKKNPGIKNVTLGLSSPSNAGVGGSYPNWDGKPEDKRVEMFWNPVSFNYFETLGVDIIIGRGFSSDFPGDVVNWEKRTSNYILNQKAISEMGIREPIGKEFEAYGFKGQIVGVVEDYNYKSLHTEIAPLFFQVSPIYFNEIIVRGNVGNPALLSHIETVWNKFVFDYPLEFSFVSNQVKDLYESEQNLVNTLKIFSLIAIVIACMGLFSLTILSMSQRIKEIGIRKVNGAKVSEILSLLNRDFIKWVVISFLIACPIAYYAMYTWLENFAYKTTLSWWIFMLAGLLTLGIALLTVSWQSYRAARKNPVEALRYE